MALCLAEYWSRCTGNIHPDDTAVFADPKYAGHGYNLDFPPPAFIGDVKTALIIILDNNGGFSNDTYREFPDECSRQEYLRRLAHPQPTDAKTAPYYRDLNCFDWLADGRAVLVNGVAYRSPGSNSQYVWRIAKQLPSARRHQDWLLKEILPQAARGERLVIVHRLGMWFGAVTKDRQYNGVTFSPSPRCPYLSLQEREKGERFLTHLASQQPSP